MPAKCNLAYASRTDSVNQTVDAVDLFVALVSKEGRIGREWAEAAANTKADLDKLREQCIEVQKTSKWSKNRILGNWTSIECTKPDNNDPRGFVITGPAAGDQCTFVAASNEESREVEGFLRLLRKFGPTLVAQEQSLIVMFDVTERCEHEASQLKHDPHATVRDHIHLLREYNDIKDVGQQLIGLIAENRGAPIGTFYQDAPYGVTSDD